jgi:two-component system, OmpR family, heavy metal sensor histidine kinase CusS
MRSTRSLLIVYFLALLAFGLGVGAVLADRVVGEVLAEREKAASESIDLRLAERVKSVRDKFDGELLTHARLIGRVARTEYFPQSDAETRQFQKQLIPIYFSGVGPAHGLWAATWQSGIQIPRRGPGPTGAQPSLYWSLFRSYFSNLQLSELFLKPIDNDDREIDFVQINGPFSTRVSRSENLITAGYSLPHDRRAFDHVLEDWIHNDVNLPAGRTGRRVVFKTPLPLLAFGRFTSTSSRGGRGDPPNPPPTSDPLQLIFIHVARSTTELERRIASFQTEASKDKIALKVDTQTTIRRVRVTLAAIGIAVFLACLMGSSWLIRRGLTPLKRLSDAVSQVSEKDFHLPVRREELSTELQPIHERIAATLEQLKSAFEREKQAVADISHELRTPVASLLATIDVALRKPRSAEQYHQTLTDCRGITKQLGQLVEKVMTLAYLDAGQTNLTAQTVDAVEVAGTCAKVIRPLAEAHGLTFSLKADRPITFDTDPDKLREVLTNLLHNAIEYNRPGGRVELNVVSEPAGVRFDVTDTGIGMTADVREKIFERFYRADPSRTATGVHAGLGLAIVKEYVDRLGGTIDVESEPDVGTTFRVTLPAA